jgi:curved DNA-binding protein
MEFKDYYQTMHLAPDATQAEVKRAYRKLARKYHPDVSQEKNAELKFKELGEAYEVLKDPEKRARYDALRQQGWKSGESFKTSPDWQQDFDRDKFNQGEESIFSDFFESLFGRQRGGQRYSSTFYQPSQGEDVYYILEVSLQDAYSGGTRTIQVPITQLTKEGRMIQSQRTINVKIPKGVVSGQQIRLRGQGKPGMGNAPAGDLYLTVQIKPTKPFAVEGRDVSIYLPVSPWEAALGAKVKTPSLGGTVELKIPPNSQTGTKLRLKGKGLPGETPGDQYVILQVVLPPVTSEEVRSIYQQMANKIAFNPRENWGA